MNVDLLWVGKARDKLADGLFARYVERLGRYARVGTAHVAEAKGRGRSVDEIRRTEADHLRKVLAERDGRVVVLDEGGRARSTRELAAWLQAEADRGTRRLSFVVGGAEGLDRVFIGEADETLSLSPLTLPHELARVVLVEQLYRSWSLLAGHPYHRD